jgi:arylsulfatase
MEVYAAMLAYQDAQIGRVLDEVERMGKRDNTLVMFIEGDNGASGEGGPTGTLNEVNHMAFGPSEQQGWLLEMSDKMGGPMTEENYPAGWALAMNTPFPWMKQVGSHLGGITNGLVVSWPAKITKSGFRHQFSHVVDVAPTILEAAGLSEPDVVDGVKQQRVDGTSFFYTFNDASAPERWLACQYETYAYAMGICSSLRSHT